MLFARPLTLPSPARGEAKTTKTTTIKKQNRRAQIAKRASPLAGEDAAKRQARGLAKSINRKAQIAKRISQKSHYYKGG